MPPRCKPPSCTGLIAAAAITLFIVSATPKGNLEIAQAFITPTALPTADAPIPRQMFVNDDSQPSMHGQPTPFGFPSSALLATNRDCNTFFFANETATDSKSKDTAKEHNGTEQKVGSSGLEGKLEKNSSGQNENLSKKVRSLSDKLRQTKIEAEQSLQSAQVYAEADRENLLGRISYLESKLSDSVELRKRFSQASEQALAASRAEMEALQMEKVQKMMDIVDSAEREKEQVIRKNARVEQEKDRLSSMYKEERKSARRHKQLERQALRQKERLSKKVHNLSAELHQVKAEAEMNIQSVQANAAAQHDKLLSEKSDLKSQLKESIRLREQDRQASEQELAVLKMELDKSIDLREQERQDSQQQLSALRAAMNLLKTEMAQAETIDVQVSAEPEERLVREFQTAKYDLDEMNGGSRSNGPNVAQQSAGCGSTEQGKKEMVREKSKDPPAKRVLFETAARVPNVVRQGDPDIVWHY